MESSTPSMSFVVRREGAVHALLRSGYESLYSSLLSEEAGTREASTEDRTFSGRAAAASIPVPDRVPERTVLRRYRHGGLFRRLTGDRFLDGRRPFRELLVIEAAHMAHVPVALPLAALSRRSGFGLFRGILATQEVPGAVDLLRFLREGATAAALTRVAARRRIGADVARAVRQLHDAGIFHADLHLKNILIRPGLDPPVVLIDFDRARALGAPLGERLRFRNLARLDRSVEKTGLAGMVLSRTDRLAFLRAYLGARRLAALPAVRRWLGLARVTRFFHRLGWLLFGTGADRRAEPRSKGLQHV